MHSRQSGRLPHHSLAIDAGEKREQEEIIVTRRTEAVDERRQKADDDKPSIQMWIVNDPVQFEVFYDQDLTSADFDRAITHPHRSPVVEWNEEFQPVVPRKIGRYLSVSQSKELDNERELGLKRLIITAVLINRGLVGAEVEPICDFQQLTILKVVFHGKRYKLLMQRDQD